MLLFVIGGVQKTSLVDFPEKVAAVVFTQGCNFRCGYCHNPDLLEFGQKTEWNEHSFFDFLKTRLGKLDGVVISGGEPTLQSDLHDFIEKIKQMGFAVKLDTNGTNPKIVEKLLKNNLLDYIAMDIKAPLFKYKEITGVNVNIDDIKQSISIIMAGSINYEFRTTVVKSQLSFEDFDKIGELIEGAKLYYLQKFVPSNIYDKSLIYETTYSDNDFGEIVKKLSTYVKEVKCR